MMSLRHASRHLCASDHSPQTNQRTKIRKMTATTSLTVCCLPLGKIIAGGGTNRRREPRSSTNTPLLGPMLPPKLTSYFLTRLRSQEKRPDFHTGVQKVGQEYRRDTTVLAISCKIRGVFDHLYPSFCSGFSFLSYGGCDSRGPMRQCRTKKGPGACCDHKSPGRGCRIQYIATTDSRVFDSVRPFLSLFF
jgi:hypothetical protein